MLQADRTGTLPGALLREHGLAPCNTRRAVAEAFGVVLAPSAFDQLRLVEDIGRDDIEIMDAAIALQRRFGIRLPLPLTVNTLGEVAALVDQARAQKKAMRP